MAEAYLLPGRSDVRCENRSNLEDIPQIPCDWDAMLAISTESAAQLNAICK